MSFFAVAGWLVAFSMCCQQVQSMDVSSARIGLPFFEELPVEVEPFKTKMMDTSKKDETEVEAK